MSGITIFTATYNRAYSLPLLYKSLLEQENKLFEWILIDDGSTDETSTLIETWIKTTTAFPIRAFYLQHGGKQRAINFAVQKALFPFFFIVDSDDLLTPDAITKALTWCGGIADTPFLAGVSGVKGAINGGYRSAPPKIDGDYVDLSNLERKSYNLDGDMAEIYKTEILKLYPFPVWPGETFTPESVVWDKIALDGYQLRWYRDIIYLCDYLDDGLTKGGYRLYLDNLMGCAMAQNMKAQTSSFFLHKISSVIEMDIACCLKKEYGFLSTSWSPLLSYCLLPFAWLKAQHRKRRLSLHI